MNRPLITDFLKQYPTCPICLEHKPEVRRRTFTIKGLEPSDLIVVDFRCPQGHYEVAVNRAFEGEDYTNVYVHYIYFITANYDISICVPDDWIRISYGFKDEVERDMKCTDYNKWMLTHDQMMKKLGKLWTIA